MQTMIDDWMLPNVPLRRKVLYTYMRLRYLREYFFYLIGFWKPPKIGQVPHFVKRNIIKGYSRKYSTRVLVETGTYLGDMIDAMFDSFEEIYSIELFAPLYEKAKLRFACRKNVRLYCGDSSHLISQIIANLNGPALFWLDAHFSGDGTARGLSDTPIIQELTTILAQKAYRHTVLIDDAADFTGKDGYPDIEELQEFVTKSRADYHLSVHDNIIFLEPAGEAIY